MEKEKNDEALLQVLSEKWKHHDALAYSRFTSSWALQAAAAAITSAIYGLSNSGTIQITLHILMALAWFLAGAGTLVFIISQKIDIRVRNTFNEKIVSTLQKLGVFDQDKGFWYPYPYNVSDSNHPINLWHTPHPERRGRDTRATKWNGRLLQALLGLDVVLLGLIINDLFKVVAI